MLSMSSCDKQFWSLFVPQAAWKFPAVRHMLTAISLLDQYLSSPMYTLIPDAEYRQALGAYNRAIACLTSPRSCDDPGHCMDEAIPLTCILLTSVLAWMFEGISNRPEIANLHITAAINIADELHQPDRYSKLSVEEAAIIDVIEHSSLGDSYTFLDLWAPKDLPPPPPFDTLAESRIALNDIIEDMKSTFPVMNTDMLLGRLRTWRIAFEAYRYKGIEPLASKRQMYLHHNIIVSIVAMTHFNTFNGENKRTRILDDMEILIESEDLAEIGEGLRLLARFLLAEDCLEEDLRMRSHGVLRKLDTHHA